ncbi:hypothetical protein [Burkholderia metallica]|uniref:Uncharacterized protein n=1 Tax=Burkholderia metallica TaxID=488729 RepID=A0ABT8PEY6_9BURK|nr:hypothetical protein [Burkholderia metallica]MCA8002432.1 hypothetical protein [Burkholderia metallica]MCA8022628.1 hypothetical protein [Burkholderia metallica]MDN7933033.1 hypothetical protein [Burkholderia metallica]
MTARGVDAAAADRTASTTLPHKLTADAKQVRAGTLSHAVGLDGREAHAERLRAFAP